MKKKCFILFTISLFFPIVGTSQVGINTDTPNILNIDDVALDINGRTILRNTNPVEGKESMDLKLLAIDENGVVTQKPNKPINLTFYQSTATNKYTDINVVNSFNNGDPFIVSWDKNNDEIQNNLLSPDTDSNGNVENFTFLEDGFYEINGILNFGVRMPNDFITMATSRVGINLTIQYSKDSGNTWIDLTNNRSILTGGILLPKQYTSFTIIIPEAIQKFYKGDKIRMILKKPLANDDDIDAFEIAKPTGSTISKALKVNLL